MSAGRRREAVCSACRSWLRNAAVLFAVALSWPLPSQGVPRGLPPDKRLADLTLTRWTTAEGLPNDTLLHVLQSEQGYLWLSSFSGLIRFDGITFKTFNKATTPELHVSGFRGVVEDRQQTLWLATQGGGLMTYANGHFETFHDDYGLNTTIRIVVIDERERIWVGVSDFGAFKHEAGSLVHLEVAGLDQVTVRYIAVDREGTVWFATEGVGLTGLPDGRLTEGAVRTYTSASGLSSDYVTALYAAGEVLWIGTLAGLDRLEGEEISGVPGLAAIGEVVYIDLDDYGNLWLATAEGLVRRNAVSGEIERLPLGAVSAFTFDREGNLWIAATAGGLYQLKQGKFTNYNRRSGLATDRINVAYEAGDGEYWVGTDNGRVHVIRGEGISTLKLPLPEARIRDIHRDRRGDLWLTTNAGVVQVSGGAATLLSERTGFPTSQVRSIFEASDGSIWIGTRNRGAVRIGDDGEYEILDQSSGLASDFIFSLNEDSQKTLLIATRGALNLVDEKRRVVRYTTAEGIPGSIVFSTFVDAKGAVWIATNGGLARLEQGRIRALGVDDGLPADSVFDYVEDGRGFAWLSSGQGVIRIEKAQLEAFMDGRVPRIDARLFDEGDGMDSRQCTGTARILTASDGKLWFPTLGGVSVLDPLRVPSNPVAPRLAISALVADGEPVGLAGRPRIAPGTKRVEVEFAALSFSAPSKVVVRYMLEGFDDDWTDAGTSRRASYTRLPAGSYTFRVRAANEDGLWNEEGAALDFTQRVFLYQKPIFQLTAALLAVALLASGVQVRLRAARRRQARLEGVIAGQKTAEAEKERLYVELEKKAAEMETFTYTVSHDLKSPLLTVRNFLGMLEQDLADGDPGLVRQDLAQIQTASNLMATLLEDLVELSRVGRLPDDPQEVDLAELAREAVMVVGGRIAERGAEVEIAAEMGVARGDRTRLLEMFQNLIDNAVKFMGEEPAPRIEIGTRKDGDETVCTVRDNGVGIEPENHERIFTVFQRLDASEEGTGIGLAMVRRVVEVHGGRIWVESEGRGRGSTFCFVLPGV